MAISTPDAGSFLQRWLPGSLSLPRRRSHFINWARQNANHWSDWWRCRWKSGVNDYDAALSHPPHVSRPIEAAPAPGRADYRILLAHQPRSLFEAADAGFDLQLSGHTRGGQCFPGHFLARLTQPFLSGLHSWDRMLIYVSTGVGTWGAPVRLGSEAEISLLLLCI